MTALLVLLREEVRNESTKFLAGPVSPAGLRGGLWNYAEQVAAVIDYRSLHQTADCLFHRNAAPDPPGRTGHSLLGYQRDDHGFDRVTPSIQSRPLRREEDRAASVGNHDCSTGRRHGLHTHVRCPEGRARCFLKGLGSGAPGRFDQTARKGKMTQHFDLKQLSDIHGLCLTIIEPLRTDPLPDSDPGARILRVAKAAATLLEERGYDEASRREYLQPILKIARNIRWTQHRGSFAIFRAPGFTVSGFWPETLEPEARLADEFFILPLLCPPVPSFWLLALSINHVRLFHGDRHMLSEVQLGRSVPDNLRDAGAFDTPDRDLENRSACGGSTGNMHAVRFGTGSENERRNRHLHDFFKQIDRAIHPHVSHDGEQLIL